MAAHQHTQWASGARKPPPSGRRKKPQTPWTRAKRKAKRHLDHHPGAALVVMIVLGALALACMALGLVLENVLYFLAMGLSALGTVAAARTRHLAEQRQQARPPKVRPERYAPPPKPKPSGEQPPAGGPVKCTETQKSIEECDCATRHVATAKGVDQFGLPLGSPIGKRKRTARESTTSRAKGSADGPSG